MIPVSILDLSPIPAGRTPADAIANSVDLAQHAERWGYRRFWLAEHHNMPGIASAATALVIGHAAAATSTIRIGSGGIMLPNHAPLVVAEQFGTLEALYPGRIDLGLGRAPGTDPLTASALRRNLDSSGDTFPRDVLELQSYLAPALPNQPVRAVPGAGSNIPMWLLGSSLFSAQLAAELGLPFAFASHFAPDALMHALHLYRTQFQPSAQCSEPYAMAVLNVVGADTAEEARRLFTSHQQSFINLRRGRPGQLPPPVDSMEDLWTPAEREMVEHTLMYAVVGSRHDIGKGIESFIERTAVNELMLTSHIYDHGARLRSFEIAAGVCLQAR